MNNDMWPPNESDSSLHPGEEHYYSGGKLKRRSLLRYGWQILTCVLLIVVILLTFTTVELLRQHSQSATAPQPMPAVATPTPSPTPKPVFTAGSTWQGTFYQHDYVGNYQTPCVFHVDTIHGTTFSGTITESTFSNAIIAETGKIVTDPNSLGYPDKQRMQIIIDRHGSAGTLIMFGDPYQLNGNNIQINSHDFALVTQDGILYGIVFDPNHDPANLTPDGDFTLYKEG